MMARLIYSAITSLDGYVSDEGGNFDWGKPDEEMHSYLNSLERSVGTYLYGRRMYEVMVYWEDPPGLADAPAYIQEFARIWKSADKVVYSTTLDTPSSAKTRIERRFDPAVVRRMKVGADRDISVSGPSLAAHAIESGLVDEYDLFIAPIVVGGGLKALPDGVRQELTFLDERRFGSGFVHLRYRSGG
jgi:dihydrofolate reductase